MLIPFITSLLPQRLLNPHQRRERDRPAAPKRTQAPARRLILFVVGSVLLASVALQTADAFRTPDSASSQFVTGAAHDDVATDGRAAPDAEESAFATQPPGVIVTQVSRNCAARARERLLTGLTHYYLQRRLRPGASSDDAADTASLTETLVGPGDPAAAITLPSCEA